MEPVPPERAVLLPVIDLMPFADPLGRFSRTMNYEQRRNLVMRRILTGLACFLTLGHVAGCADHSGLPRTLAQNVDLQRYQGRWYIIANIPYFLENGKVGSYFDVSIADGKVVDVYNAHDTNFDAKLDQFTLHGYVVPDTGNARWRESPFWPLYFSYLVLDVSPDYQTALVGYPGAGYGWILSRQPDMDDAAYKALLDKMAGEGYDPSLFRRVPQTPAQIGRAGFQ
jgi:apolipoprotein D and lipocalin family protein